MGRVSLVFSPPVYTIPLPQAQTATLKTNPNVTIFLQSLVLPPVHLIDCLGKYPREIFYYNLYILDYLYYILNLTKFPRQRGHRRKNIENRSKNDPLK